MALFKEHPPHVRKRIALSWTVGIALVLVAVFAIIHIGPKRDEDTETTSKFKAFYETISEDAQSFFDQN